MHRTPTDRQQHTDRFDQVSECIRFHRIVSQHRVRRDTLHLPPAKVITSVWRTLVRIRRVHWWTARARTASMVDGWKLRAQGRFSLSNKNKRVIKDKRFSSRGIEWWSIRPTNGGATGAATLRLEQMGIRLDVPLQRRVRRSVGSNKRLRTDYTSAAEGTNERVLWRLCSTALGASVPVRWYSSTTKRGVLSMRILPIRTSWLLLLLLERCRKGSWSGKVTADVGSMPFVFCQGTIGLHRRWIAL